MEEARSSHSPPSWPPFHTLQISGLLFRNGNKVKTQIFEATGETDDNVLSTGARRGEWKSFYLKKGPY